MKECGIGALGIVFAIAGCAASSGGGSAGASIDETCAAIPAPPDGETVVVMRDQSTSTSVVGVVPAGPEKFGDAVAVVGPVVVTSDATGVAYSGSETSVEMRPCDPAMMKAK
ncbi:MAG: hypothetical protein ACWA5T_03745 [Parvularcula sp.]